MFSNKVRYFGFLVLFILTVGAVNGAIRQAFDLQPAWVDIVEHTGGELMGTYNGMPCAWFEADNQMICYLEKDTWYGRDAVPAWVVENGTCTPLFSECQ